MRDIMPYLDKTFCASPNCKNNCGRQLTPELKAKNIHNEWVSYAYFCGRDETDPELLGYIECGTNVPEGFALLNGKVTIAE